MPSRRHDQSLNPWIAAVYFCNKRYWLGSHPSRFLAMQAEERFKNELHLCRLQADELWRGNLACSS